MSEFYQALCKILCCILCLVFYTVANAKTTPDQPHIHVIQLHGTDFQMGEQYGEAMKSPLHRTLAILENYYIKEKKLTFMQLVGQANLLYQRFPQANQDMIQGMAKGADLSLDEAKILNGMETLGELLSAWRLSHCAFLFLPPNHTETGAALIGRNYDYGKPFDVIAKDLTVTIVNKPDHLSTALIGLPGQMYCPTCVNNQGVFMELNNGMPSGGDAVNIKQTSMLAAMQTIDEKSSSLSQVQKRLNAVGSDFSLIVNTASQTKTQSYEYSTKLNIHHDVFPALGSIFASTNFFLSPAWQNIPAPTDATTWMGVTRRRNLLHLAAKQTHFTVADIESLMNRKLIEGGAAWPMTIYQVIYDSANHTLYLKVMADAAKGWQKIPLFT